MRQKTISIVCGTYNESGNIGEFCNRVADVMSTLPKYNYNICIIDNKSTDSTRDEIRDICKYNKRVRAIFNIRNFGVIRSTAYALCMQKEDAVIALASDLEDPPEIIPELLEKWESGYKVVYMVRSGTKERGIIPLFRKLYYYIIEMISETRQIPNATGAGLYDQKVVSQIRDIDDPYPYMRGLVCELGWPIATVQFIKPVRKRGKSSYNFLKYFDFALTGIVNHSKLPLRLATLFGFGVSGISFCIGLFYFLKKLLYWDSFQLGLAPIIVGVFFLMGLLFFFMGIIGEYVGLVVTHVVRRPIVVEEERVNFMETDEDDRK